MDQSGIQGVLDAIVPFVTTYGLRVLGAIVILIAGKIAAGVCADILRRVLERAKTDRALVGFLTSLVRYAVLAFAVIAALAKFGIQTTSFVAIIGAAGLAVGLALQGSLANFAAGILISIFRPFKIGDSSVNFVIRPRAKSPDYWDVYFDVTRTIKEEFDKNGISIPFPQQDVHMHQVAN
jgi:small conductance mechanosensitive channel